MATAILTRGTTITYDFGTQKAIQAIIIEDPDPTVGEAEVSTEQAHDGTKYTTAGETGDNGLSITVLSTVEDFETIMTGAYGTPTVDVNKKTWDMATPTGLSGTISAESPIVNGTQISHVLKNAKTLSITPQFNGGSFFKSIINMTGDNWESSIETGL